MDKQTDLQKDDLADALALAAQMHHGQKDKAGRPYMEHICAVVAGCKSAEAKVVAALHDIVEDTPVSLEDIRQQFGESICNAIEALTKLDGEAYDDFLERVSFNPLAREVKLADMKHNADIKRIEIPTESDLRRKEKYDRAIDWLSTLDQK